jgi:homopolymeric O-antigen transport system ATP-binding protein
MSDVVIRAENLGKKFVIGHEAERERYVALRDVMARTARNLASATVGLLSGRKGDGRTTEEFWALKDVNFEVRRGEVLGIIGRNGAGKSTLLKVLSRITDPSEGRATIAGRVASLLEVGTGFHPELTGRENIYLNGGVLGMTRAEVRRKFDEIVAFAEVERFLDTPVKRYSSGMYVRLAFAVAAHLQPDILIVDEVLAVGDAEFQKKCLGRMRSVSSKEGRTVLFVSHNMTAINSLCNPVMLLNQGHVQQIGPAEDISKLYVASGASGVERRKSWTYREAPGDERVKVARIEVMTGDAEDEAAIGLDTPFRIEIDYWNLLDKANVLIELIVRASDGTAVFHSYSSETDENAGTALPKGLFRSSCEIPGNFLNAGRYAIEMYLSDGRPTNELGVTDAVCVVINEMKGRGNLNYRGRFLGHVHPKLKWRSQMLPATGLDD